MNRRTTLAVLVALLGGVFSAFATTVRPPSFDQLVAESSSVVRATVVSKRCEWRTSGDSRFIVTVVSFDLNESITGEAPQRFELEFLGGEIGGEAVVVAGQPVFKPGDEDVLFVDRRKSSVCPLVAMMFGRYLVVQDADGQPFIARQNGVPLAAVEEVSTPLLDGPMAQRLMHMKLGTGMTPDAFAEAVRARATPRENK